MFQIYTRQNGETVIELNQRSSPPPPPYELIGLVPEAIYQRRVSELMSLLKRYHWPTFLKCYLFFAIFLSIVAPFPIMLGIQAAFLKNIDLSTDPVDANGEAILTQAQVHQFFVARLVSFLVIIGFSIFIWVPYMIFIAIGNRKINKLLNTWTEADSNPQRPAHQHLKWSLRTVSTFSGRANLIVRMSIESTKSVSNFHPNAYLPSYIAGAPSGVWDPTANEGRGGYVNQPPQSQNGNGFRPPSQPPVDHMSPVSLGDPEKMV
jgi:hypothetical protein